MKENYLKVSYCLSDICNLCLEYFENKLNKSITIDELVTEILKKNSDVDIINLKIFKYIKVKIKIILSIYNELEICYYDKKKEELIWNGFGKVSSNINLIKLKNLKKNSQNSIFIKILLITIKKCLKSDGKIEFKDCVKEINLFCNETLKWSIKNISRRLYDVINILSSSGLIIYKKKQIIIPDEVKKNYKEYYSKLDKNKLIKKKRKSPTNKSKSKKVKITDAKLLLEFSKN